MIHEEDGSSGKPNYDSFDSLADKRKLRPVIKSKNICFKRSRGQLHISSLSSSMANDLSRSRIYYNSPSRDPDMKLTLMNLIPRNPAQETSEGVQELIKHVSQFIEKRNPFKDGSSTEKKEKTQEADCTSSKLSMKSCVSKDTLQSNRKPKSTNGDRKLGKTVQSTTAKSFRDVVVSPRSDSKSKSMSYASRRYMQTRKRLLQPGSKSESMDENETKVKPFSKTRPNSPPKENTEKNSAQTEKRPTKVGYKTEPGKARLKPSEIPLRKNRKDVHKVKQTTHVTTKTVNETNITTLDHDNTNRMSGTNINREILGLRHCDGEIDNEKQESSSATHTYPKDDYTTPDKDEVKYNADNNEDIRLNRSTKNASIPELSNHQPKVRMLDLEQVRSSTFTVLTTLSNTLHRLESIHQQNIGLKENGNDKLLGSKSSKHKILTPKSSFNLLKVKGSKKNLSSRLSSKGNKPGLKNKKKKSKTELGANRTSSFQENIKTGTRENPRVVKSVMSSKPIPPIRNKVPISKNKNSEGENKNQKTTSTKKPDGASRGSGVSRVKALTPKVTTPKTQGGFGTGTGFNQKLLVALGQTTSDKPEDSYQTLREDEDPFLKNNNETSNYISCSEGLRVVTTPIDRRNSDVVIVEGSTKTKSPVPASIVAQNKKKKPEPSKGESKTKPGDQTRVKKQKESSKVSTKDLKVFERVVKLPEETVPDKEEESESEKVQLRITIDVNSQEDCSFSGKKITEDGMNVCSFNWLFMNNKKYGQECEQQLNDMREPEQQEITMEEEEAPSLIIKEEAPPQFDDTVPECVTDELAASKELETGLEKHYRGSQMMKRRPRPKYKTPVINVKRVVEKMKTRSDPGNRSFFTSNGRFNNAIHFQNKMNKTKADTKLRSGLTRSFNRDANIGSERHDHFDDTNSVKLKRRNSEPFSFRGFIWRHQDTVPPRGNKASASSLGSSLKHLNTDDLEDFIFWESVPPRVTSCWETSLYHFKRPWSVLSCSVFKDNRLSNTPGLILENIRNGNCSTRRWSASQETERVSNSFDVEPSITQKNIDVRNWLAALNFQSPPSTSSDVIREGSVSPQTLTLNQEFKTPILQKRRKVFPGLKVCESEENKISGKDSDKYNTEASDVGLMELIRRKSGGFVTAEQYFNSNRSSHGKSNRRHKSKPHFRVLEDLEDSDVEKLVESEPQVPKEEKMVQVALDDFVPPPSCPSVEILEKPSTNQDIEATPPQSSKPLTLKKFIRGDTELMTSNVWKYLFMFTLFILVTYYVSRSKHSCRG